MDNLAIKQTLLAFTVDKVEQFLRENPELIFYAFAYDCNAEYAEVNLCFNTQQDFENSLIESQAKYPCDYLLDSQITDFKYNIGNWAFQCFESIQLLTENQLTDLFDSLPEDNYQSWHRVVAELMQLFDECLLEFLKSDSFKKIPKTQDFIAFSIDHDEEVEVAIARWQAKLI